jgi:hypothetical protein
MRKTFALPKSIYNLSKCLGKVTRTNVPKWCRLFIGERTDVHNKAKSGRPSYITEDLKDEVDAHVRVNMRFAVDELHEVFSVFPLRKCHGSIPIQKNVCQMGSKTLTDKHKQKK